MHVFDRDTALEQENDTVFSLALSDKWAINNSANGGYIMALLARAMDCRPLENDCPDRAAILTANYIDRCYHGPSQIRVETMGESGNFIRKQARLIQEGRECIRAMGTFVKPGLNRFARDYERGPEPVALWEDCIVMPAMPGYSLFDQVDLRLDPVSAGWMQGQLADRAVMKGWIEFTQDRPLDLPALALFADCFPPCVFAARGMVAWVPTIEYSVNIRQLPESNRVRGIFTTKFISNGLVEEDGELWDVSGNLVAVSRQIAKYHSA